MFASCLHITILVKMLLIIVFTVSVYRTDIGRIFKISAWYRIGSYLLYRYIFSEKSGGLHLTKPGLTAGWQAGSLADKIWARLHECSCYVQTKSGYQLLWR